MSKALRLLVAAVPVAAAGALLTRSRKRLRPLVPYHAARRRVLVLGGGFGGFGAAAGIARVAPDGTSVLAIDRHDFLTFWPMVPEVVPGSIEVQHALRPLASELLRSGAAFQRAEVESVDLDAHQVQTSAGAFGYDDLVIALGWKTTFHGVKGAAEYALVLDTIEDAVRIRDRAIDHLEQASAAANQGRAPDPSLLSFVVVGGGSTGVEVAANLRDLLDDLLGRYPAISRQAAGVHLLQAAGEVLPHLDPRLERIAQARLQASRIHVRTRAKAASVDDSGISLTDGSRIDTRCVVWAAGVQPNPIAHKIKGAPIDDRGRLQVDEFLRLEGRPNVFALGDIAAATSGRQPVPPTAQAAVQEAECVARNVLASMRAASPQPFRYHYMGQLVDLGSRFAVSQVMGRKVSGGLAQLMWRATYLYKLGNMRDRSRVVADWALDALTGPRVSRLPLA